MYDALAAAALLGLAHGANPFSGWLMVFLYSVRGGFKGFLGSWAAVAAGHAAAVSLVVAPLSLWWSPLAAVTAGGVMAALGVAQALGRARAPRYMGYSSGLPIIALWSFSYALAHGSALTVAAAIELSGHPSPSLALAIAAIHAGSAAAAIAVSASAALAAYRMLGPSTLRAALRVNYDAVWGLLTALLGVALAALGLSRLF